MADRPRGDMTHTLEQRERWFNRLVGIAPESAKQWKSYGRQDRAAGAELCTAVHVQAGAWGDTPWTVANVDRYVVVQDADDGDTCLYVTDRGHLADELRDRLGEEGWYIRSVIDLETGDEVVYEAETFIYLHQLPPTAEERADAAQQIEALVNAGETSVLVDFLQQEQVLQLAKDWNEGK